nr:alpha 1-protease inhibitor, alpha 1-PI {N-terminal} [dogs, plasma, Peptide Partial, 23 aa] [Canis lupus familiaris]
EGLQGDAVQETDDPEHQPAHHKI